VSIFRRATSRHALQYDRPDRSRPSNPFACARGTPHTTDTPILSYSLKGYPHRTPSFVNWQQEPAGANWSAFGFVFPEKATELKIEVDFTRRR